MRSVVDHIVRHIHADGRMVPSSTAACEATVDASGIYRLDLTEVMDVVVHRLVPGGDARAGGFIATAEPDAAGAEVMELVALRGVVFPTTENDGVVVDVSNYATRDEVPLPSADVNAIAEIELHGEVAQSDVGGVFEADNRRFLIHQHDLGRF